VNQDMRRHIRIGIFGESPCEQCTAACCKQNGHEFAALLRDDEVRKFAAFAVDVPIRSGDRIVIERVLPYRDSRCQFLGQDDRCTIYDDRPMACRKFQCISAYNRDGVGRHGQFLELNPPVKELLDRL
jgi:Fe-S-cluster containining protein